ncbi:hypothetical protein CTA2_12884 [Colletotrichum tanaceti]|nr:hypothetical protein CTA2_12884 [Colletotrichum tanaceti]
MDNHNTSSTARRKSTASSSVAASGTDTRPRRVRPSRARGLRTSTGCRTGAANTPSPLPLILKWLRRPGIARSRSCRRRPTRISRTTISQTYLT